MTIRANANKLIVTGWTSTNYFINISKENILQEFDDLKSSFSHLSKSVTELNDLVKLKDLKIEYNMSFDDYGKTGIGLCSEIDGELNWYI